VRPAGTRKWSNPRDQASVFRRLTSWPQVSKEIQLQALNVTKALSRVTKFVLSHRLLFVAIVTYSVVFSIYSILKYYALRATYLDLGVYNQSFWVDAFGGNFLRINSLFFAGHLSPLLVALLPVYFLVPGPPTLLVIQSFALGLAAVPIYLLVQDVESDRRVATIIAATYLLYPALHGVNGFDFHAVAFFPLTAGFALLYWRRRNWKPYYVSLTLAMATLEFAPYIILFMGLGELLQTLRNKFAERALVRHALLTILVAGVTLVVYLIVTPLASTRLAVNYLTGGVGANISVVPVTHVYDIPGYFLSHPVEVGQLIFVGFPAKFLYFLELLGPLMFLPVLDAFSWVPLLPWTFVVLLGRRWPYYSIYFHYSALVIPFLFASLASGLDKLEVSKSSLRRLSKGIILTTLIFSSYVSILSPLNPYNGEVSDLPHSSWWPTRSSHVDALDRVAALIPQDAYLMTQNDIGSMVSSRREMYVPPADWPPQKTPDFVLADTTSTWFYTIFRYLNDLLNETSFRGTQYGVYASADGILLYKRDYTGPPVLFEPYKVTFSPSQLIIASSNMIQDNSSSTGRVLVSLHKSNRLFWYGPYVTLPPGWYNVTYRLKIGSSSRDHILTIDVTSDKGKRVIVSSEVSGNAQNPSQWQLITLSFHLTAPTLNLEFRGLQTSPDADIYLDSITLVQSTGS